MLQNSVNNCSNFKSLVSLTDLINFNWIGTIDIVAKETEIPTQATLYREDRKKGITVYAIISENNRHNLLGRITVKVISFLKNNPKIDINKEDEKFYFDNKDLYPSLYVKTLFAPGKMFFKGIGNKLLSWAKEYSVSHGCERRLILEAKMSSHGFYQKQKLRAMTGMEDLSAREIDQKIAQLSPNTSEIGDLLMYLPRENV